MSISDPIPSQTIIDTLFVIAPQFYTTDPMKLANYNTMIGLLRCQVNEQVLSCCGVLAYVYLLAHWLQLQTSPQTGVATNLSEGELSIGLAISPDSSILNATQYGRLYKDLIKRTVIGSTVTNLPPNFAVINACCCQG